MQSLLEMQAGIKLPSSAQGRGRCTVRAIPPSERVQYFSHPAKASRLESQSAAIGVGLLLRTLSRASDAVDGRYISSQYGQAHTRTAIYSVPERYIRSIESVGNVRIHGSGRGFRHSRRLCLLLRSEWP
jgi:hypothetical protein